MANCEAGDDPVNTFTEILITVANQTIQKSKSGKRTVNTVFFNSDCADARRRRRKAQRLATASPTVLNMDNYSIVQANCRQTIRTSRRQSWQSFISKINSRTSLKKVWNVISKISGKKICYGYPPPICKQH